MTRPMPVLAAAGLLALLSACKEKAAPAAPPVATPAALAAQSAEFRKEVIKAADNVYVAVGYGIANSIMLVGTDGIVIVDTMEDEATAQAVLTEFRKITDKPVKALVYTHSHPDHIGGARVFSGGSDQVPVYAQREVIRNMDRTTFELQEAITRRSLRMYGPLLPPEEMVNVGLGPGLEIHEGSVIDILRPTQLFDESLKVSVAGIDMELVHAPGETTDQIFVWLSAQRVLLPGDNLYKTFPNLYTIRGTTYRDPRLWADSLDKMRALKPAVLVPSHTRPLVGEQLIGEVLTTYRDGIRYVNDQTLRLTNLGYTPDEIAPRIKLPPHLASSPFLQEFYGKPSWSARSIYSGNLGWFDGNPTNLQPLPPQEQAQKMIALAGGGEAMLKQAREAAGKGESQWVLQLTDWLLRVQPDAAEAKQLRIAALRALGEREANPNARHWYLMTSRELAGEFKLPGRMVQPRPEMLAQMPLHRFFDALAINLNPEASADVTIAVAFEFTDSPERYTYLVRRGVSEVVPESRADADVVVRVSAQAFKEMLARLRNPAVSLVRDFEVTKGGKLEFARFMKLFEPMEQGH
ncbi:MAG TPA: alkyl sulfatase dimerization domain-containing protein [Solimonas sp.]|nr:alkyl sulfatase dimerization domain-containing protein [Solimonas sp.]